MSCELCTPGNENVLWRDARCRIVLVPDPAFPAYCRVIWHAHVREMTDLAPTDRAYLMHCVWATEAAVRETLAPDKINLASLGNVVPHLHWHVIPRFSNDSHFPQPIWAPALRVAPARNMQTGLLQTRLLSILGQA